MKKRLPAKFSNPEKKGVGIFYKNVNIKGIIKTKV